MPAKTTEPVLSDVQYGVQGIVDVRQGKRGPEWKIRWHDSLEPKSAISDDILKPYHGGYTWEGKKRKRTKVR